MPLSLFLCSRGELQRESDFMASVDSSWISWGVGVFLLKPLKWTLSNMLGDNKVPAEEVLVAVELLKVVMQNGGGELGGIRCDRVTTSILRKILSLCQVMGLRLSLHDVFCHELCWVIYSLGYFNISRVSFVWNCQ